MTHPLTFRHFLLALAVVFIWGTNFVVIKLALHDLPPLLFAALRFTLVVFPAIFFMKRPAVAWWNVAAYGVLIGAGQFGLLFIAMKNDISPGLASLVVQAQVFFTIGLSMLVTGERMKAYQWPALLLAAGGIVVIGLHANAATTLLGIVLVLGAAAAWACGNTVGRYAAAGEAANGEAGNINMLSYVVWSSPFAALCLWCLAYIFEGAGPVMAGLNHLSLSIWAAILWQAAGNSIFGYAVWAWLLSRYPASTVTPMALLVPVFGMASSTLFLQEPMPVWKIAAAAMVMAGLAINLLYRGSDLRLDLFSGWQLRQRALPDIVVN